MPDKDSFSTQYIAYNRPDISRRLFRMGGLTLLCSLAGVPHLMILKLFWIPAFVLGYNFIRHFRLFISSPPIYINDNGIEDTRSGYGLIEAKDIEFVGRTNAFKKRVLEIIVNDNDRYMNRLDQKERKTAERNVSEGYSPILLEFDFLNSTADEAREFYLRSFWPIWKGVPLPPDPMGDQLMYINRKGLLKTWAQNKQAWNCIVEDKLLYVSLKATSVCTIDGNSCLLAVGDEQVVYYAKKFFSDIYSNNTNLCEIKSVSINQGHGFIQLKITAKTGTNIFDNLNTSDAVDIAEAIASKKNMVRSGNRWESLT